MINAAMLQVIHDCGESVLILADGLEEADLQRSRLTRAEVRRQLTLMAGTITGLPAPARAAMPELGSPESADQLLLARQRSRAGELHRTNGDDGAG